ncbi:creatininase family protein [Rubrolithibacter danxiaensis]|uniref:creatininase family protein n=1 Tax=Rubrolithibacter danxiaensis TaxID=3390805 RepID=UPI003BF78758
MKHLAFLLLFFFSVVGIAQEIPSRWDELTASDFPKAVEKSARTCILPIGILEKHGPHSPLGTDLIHVRDIAARAVKNEYAVTFPDYFYGQINEAKHQPGTFALSSDVIWKLMEATCDEIARNGFNKIIIVNGHGGNPEFIRFFMQSLLNKRKNYAVFFCNVYESNDKAFNQKLSVMRKTPAEGDQHGGETETSTLLYLHPELMKMDRADQESGADQKRSDLPSGIYTPIWWYSSFPNHYAGIGSKATKELGKMIVDHEVDSFTKVIKAVKADTKTLEVQDKFYDQVDQLNKK